MSNITLPRYFTSEPGGKNETLLFLIGMALESAGDASSSNLVLLNNSLALLDVGRFLSLCLNESNMSCFFIPLLPALFTTNEVFLGQSFLVGSSIISIVFGISESSYSSSSLDEMEMSLPGSLRTLLMRISVNVAKIPFYHQKI